MMSRQTKPGVYSIVSAEESGGRPRSPLCLPRWTCYALVAGGVVIVCGLIATLWVWTRFGSAGFTGKSPPEHPRTASLVLGPVLALAGVCGMVVACAVYEVRQRRAARLARTRQEFFDPLSFPEPV